MSHYTLLSGEALQAEYPESFELPARAERESVPVGGLVKLIFNFSEGAERMWVHVLRHLPSGGYFGVLNSNLSFSVKQRPINKQRKKIMSKTHIPITGSLQRIVLEKLIENGEAGVTFLDFPKDSGITEDLLDEIMESLGSGDFEVEATH